MLYFLENLLYVIKDSEGALTPPSPPKHSGKTLGVHAQGWLLANGVSSVCSPVMGCGHPGDSSEHLARLRRIRCDDRGESGFYSAGQTQAEVRLPHPHPSQWAQSRKTHVWVRL